MQSASVRYKESMKGKLREISYMKVTIGLVNQQAQASAFVPYPDNYTYYSNLHKPLDNYQVAELYATCEQNYTTADGNMYFLPRSKKDVILNAGIVANTLLGSIEICFPVPFSIKGLTIDFGKAYPVDFMITADNNRVSIKGNKESLFVTEEVFTNTTSLLFTPQSMVNGQGRLRIHQITMGIGIYFDNRKILSASKKEYIDPIMGDLPAIDFSLTVENRDRAFDIENSESSVNFLESGQSVEVVYGYDLGDTIEWMSGAKLTLKEWSADDQEMGFSATDRFDGLDRIYYKGDYRQEGISLYDLTVDVFTDAAIDTRTYWIDSYLKGIMVNNPLPPVTHKEALQLIANAGRCILYQDRLGNIFIKSSFIPDMVSGSTNETYFSHADGLLNKSTRVEYGLSTQDYTKADMRQYFLPRGVSNLLSTGYISEAVSNASGVFLQNPTIQILLEAAYKCFGITLEFGSNPPVEFKIRTYKDDIYLEDYLVTEVSGITVINREFAEFDYMIIEFTKGAPNNRITLDNITFGDATDYVLAYSDMMQTPRGTQLTKVKELQIIQTLFGSNTEAKELIKETINITSGSNQFTYYFSNPAYELTCSITDAQSGQMASILSYSAYYINIEVTGINGATELVITGREYVVNQAKITKFLNYQGTIETWENPLISSQQHASDIAEWIGDYMSSGQEYAISYRGEPRLDANDIAFIQNKYVDNLIIRIYEHTLNFNGGALSGSIKARRDMSYVGTTKDQLGIK